MRLASLIVLLLELVSASASQPGSGAGEIPTRFRMAINGFMGAAHGVLLQDGVLVYTQYGLNGTKQQKTITPSPDQWRQFRQALDAIKVWQWRANYPNPGVADGMDWLIDVTYSDRTLHAEGNNNYPDDNGRAVNEARQTKAFERLLSAVQSLLGDPSF
jgi:hypothetical protein